jgi:hypothetical protein
VGTESLAHSGLTPWMKSLRSVRRTRASHPPQWMSGRESLDASQRGTVDESQKPIAGRGGT